MKDIILMLFAFIALPTNAQIFNFSLRTNNQQLIDEALTGAFIRINQSYELCDTIKGEHFGRDGKDYFSVIPFIGIETEKGLIFPSAALEPWACDRDFVQYQGQYKPLVTKTAIGVLNDCKSQEIRNAKGTFAGTPVSKRLCVYGDSANMSQGLKVDTLSGVKKGWLIWLSSDSNLATSDSVRITSIKKDVEIPSEGGSISLDKPDIPETVYGGFYFTPTRTALGQLTFTFTGVALLDGDEWLLEVPFVHKSAEKKPLTPIAGTSTEAKLNSLKKKRK